MRIFPCFPPIGAVLATLAFCVPALAAGRVELVIVGEGSVQAEFHAWMDVLTKSGATAVRLRSPQPTDQIGIDVQGTADSPTYVVTGMISGRGDLVLPGGRFTRNDGSRIAQWIADIAKNGPPERREARSAFGLTTSQFEKVRADLSQPLGVDTQGKSRAEVAAAVAGKVRFPVRLDPAARALLETEKVRDELSTLTCGTVLACVLRPAGLAFVPRAEGAEVAYVIGRAEKGDEIWPVGWAPSKPARDIMPVLFEFLTVNIQNVTVSTAIEAIGKRLQAPLLLDYNAMARHGIEPEKVNVALPSGKSTYSLILGKVLFQARLKYEVRVDEAGTPFLWVTSVKPLK